uniref:Elongator complex protein 1 n=1 Tax=Anabas testudineus TaxID=64144 RepID=A0A7N6A6W0_ANATE
MRNLKLLKSLRSSELQGPGSPQYLSVRADTGTLLVLSQYSITEFDPRTGQVVNEASLTADGFLPDDGCGVVVGLQDLAELESACLATAGGDVILFNLNTCQVECVGSVDSGLTSMSWSPDEELVVLTTGQETIIMMTKDFEPIIEFGIHQDDFGEGKFITVGWGKKETQFHGSEGKQAAQRKLQVQPAAAWDDHRPRVTWRGDGQLFAVSAVCPQTGGRKVRVWNREGVLQATSEPISGLEQALCWKPSGSLIASSQRHPNKHSVVFMEKNGLLHGDFTLPFSKDQAKVKDLLWNSDSTVLAVWLEDMTPGEDGQVNTYVQLWTVGNYHWYLKQSLDFGKDPQKAPVCVGWDPERPLRLHMVTRGWTTITYDWGWNTDRSPGVDDTDNANVAVIDGDKVLMTTFRKCVVPPPMCSFELQLKSPVNQVTFLCRPQKTNQLAALTADRQISVYGKDSREDVDKTADGFRVISPHCLITVLPTHVPRVAALQDDPLVLRQLLWLEDELFVGVSSGLLPTSSTLVMLRPAQDADDTLSVRSAFKVDGVVVSMVQSLIISEGKHFSSPCVCLFTSVLLQLASNVSSFAVCNDFLLITTHSHTCRCLHLSSLSVKGLQVALASDGNQNDETLRRVERGSRIVTVVPQDTRVILQVSLTHERLFHVKLIKLREFVLTLVVLICFREAFECMRKLRINLNLICDHNPKVFLDNIETFITQLNSINDVNLFLTELKEEDTTSTMYPHPESSPIQPQPASGQKKVDVVCDALRGAMESMDPNKFCLSILTAHVKKTVPELEIALQKVHELRGERISTPGAVSAEEALKYLLFLVNVNDLYEHSLGTYDFDLVLMVAEKSQKDPKEYLPFLNMLKSLEPNYQRYTIDKHLKRYKKALHHLSKCGEQHFPEALQLVKEQKLYSEALRMFSANSSHYKALSCAYAEHLVQQQQAEQAGLLLWRCGEPVSALQAFASSTSWRNAICVAQQIPLPPDQLALLARDLLNSDLGFCFQQDCEEAILALITGAVWEEALRLVSKQSSAVLLVFSLYKCLRQPCNIMFICQYVAVTLSPQTHHNIIYRIIYRIYLGYIVKPPSCPTDEDGPDCPDAELYSEASSVMTNSKYSQSNSRISSRSSKNRRKAERKKLSLKEGSPMEDRALMYALGEIKDVHSLLKALVLFEFDKQAEKLQLAYEDALQMMAAAVPEVWPEGLQNNQAPLTGPNSTANSIMASFQQQQKPVVSQQGRQRSVLNQPFSSCYIDHFCCLNSPDDDDNNMSLLSVSKCFSLQMLRS